MVTSSLMIPVETRLNLAVFPLILPTDFGFRASQGTYIRGVVIIHARCAYARKTFSIFIYMAAQAG